MSSPRSGTPSSSRCCCPTRAQKYGLEQDIVVGRDGLVHVPNGPGLGAAIDFKLIERKKISVLT